MEILFWVCVATVAYAYLGYPLLIRRLSAWFGGEPAAAGMPAHSLPSVSLIVAAHNEEDVIEQSLLNALAIDYPKDRFEILVGSDGSSDRTAAIVRRFERRGVRLLDYPVRRGKASVLNSAIADADSDVILLSDANTRIDPAAARKLVRRLGDPGVVAVCGRLVLTDPVTGGNADSLYWRYETFLKKCEGRLGALLGSNGAIYAMRRSDYVPIPGDTIVDDFVIPLLAKLKRGGAIVYEADAIAHEETAPGVGCEFHRRSRIGAGGFQAIGMLWRLLDPRRGWVAFTFLSHKILRWLCPFFLLGALASNVFLLHRPVNRLTLAAQACVYFLAWGMTFVPDRLRVLKPLRLTTMFACMNVALLAGFFRWLRGTQRATWRRTARLSDTPDSDLLVPPESADVGGVVV